MKFFRNFSKKSSANAKKITWPLLGVAALATFVVSTSREVYSPIVRKMNLKSDKTVAQRSTLIGTLTPRFRSGPTATATTQPQVESLQSPNFSHSDIVTTIFWVGEPADADNGYIANDQSAWDGHWKQHYGGFDDPNNRVGYSPAAFTPKENPFYFALPYSDIDDNGNRKASATNCPLYAAMKKQPYSWCKNSWIAVRHNGKTVYAQWEDTGPYQEDDLAYVFGSAAPKNQVDVKSGLDVSPAVRDYLGLKDVSNCDWAFVSATEVPTGPWSQIITTGLGDSI